MIHIQNLVGGYANKPIIKGISCEIEKGEFFALLGPNGSGKTTLFKLITGQLPIQEGSIEIDGKALSQLTKLEKARKVAVLSQEVSVSFDYTVKEIISLGRYPHQKGMFKRLTSADWDVIHHVMKISKVDKFHNTQFRTISGGEKQRVLLAKALAQEPDILLLDEPTNHLDIKHTFQMLNQLKEWQRTKGLTVFAILHDLNVASLYADRIALLHEGAFLEVGDVNTLRKEEQLKRVYEVDVKTQSHPTVPKPQLLMTPSHSKSGKKEPFHDLYTMNKNDQSLLIQFEEPMRAISNGIIGSGIQWLTHFSLLNAKKASTDEKKDLLMWMKTHNIPVEQATGTITIGKEIRVAIQKKIDGIECMALVLAECGSMEEEGSVLGAIHIMIFVDHYLQDDTLLSGFTAATEAKMMAIYNTNDRSSSRTRDSLVLAGRENEENSLQKLPRAQLLKSIEQLAYEATQMVLKEQKDAIKFVD